MPTRAHAPLVVGKVTRTVEVPGSIMAPVAVLITLLGCPP